MATCLRGALGLRSPPLARALASSSAPLHAPFRATAVAQAPKKKGACRGDNVIGL